ncbi:MAG: patatin-like phospholipase family protein [Anaerolineae bacterium]
MAGQTKYDKAQPMNVQIGKTVAFVLSGGGNRGALQVGALQVLLERGVRPNILVGTSAGALNAASLALDPTLAGAQRLAKTWEGVKKRNVYPGGYAAVLWRLIRNEESLYPNANFQRFLQRYLRALHVERFGDITSGVHLYLVATRLDTGMTHVFGDDPNDLLLDALMASTALPPFHPPWQCNGIAYVDGGMTADLPICIAAERGAQEIYALHVTTAPQPPTRLHGVLEISAHALQSLLERQLRCELQKAAELPNVQLHYIPFTAYAGLPFWDFSHASEMIAEGRAVMEAYLATVARPQRTWEYPWRRIVREQWHRARKAFVRAARPSRNQ